VDDREVIGGVRRHPLGPEYEPHLLVTRDTLDAEIRAVSRRDNASLRIAWRLHVKIGRANITHHSKVRCGIHGNRQRTEVRQIAGRHRLRRYLAGSILKRQLKSVMGQSMLHDR